MALRLDRAAVRRSAPLRRGLASLAVIPSGVAAASGLPWPLLPLLPGLVDPASGLLFGVNAFALDGQGALWRETLPGDPRQYLLARLVVLAETCLGGATVCVLAATLRAPGAPTAARLAMGTTLLGIVFVWLADLTSIASTALITLGTLLISARRLVAVAGQWQDPAVRSRVLTIVADA
jgi:hypothetical protein